MNHKLSNAHFDTNLHSNILNEN